MTRSVSDLKLNDLLPPLGMMKIKLNLLFKKKKIHSNTLPVPTKAWYSYDSWLPHFTTLLRIQFCRYKIAVNNCKWL